MKKKKNGNGTTESGSGLDDLLRWLLDLNVISEANRETYLEVPHEFIIELCQGMILPKLAVLASQVFCEIN